MRGTRLQVYGFFLLQLAALAAAAAGADGPLTFDALVKSHQVKRGETNASFVFQFANTTAAEVTIQALRATCPCTAASVPATLPWRLPAGQSGRLDIHVDLRDRWEAFKQIVAIETTAGTNQVELFIRTAELTPREKNRRAAFADRQAVFKGECAKCHLHPATGQPLGIQYQILCGTCHDAADRAEMVPALASTSKGKNRAYWDEWVRRGKPGTFMPAFGKRWGGPLTEPEVERLLDFISTRFSD